jgi:hypothetical protein
MNSERKKANLILTMVISLMFLGTSSSLAAGLKEIRKYAIPDHGVLELNMPISWQSNIYKPRENLPLTIIFAPTEGNDFQGLITVLWDTVGESDFNNPEKVRTLVEKDGKKVLPRAVESTIVLKEIRGPQNTGYFYSLTDKAPKPGEFRYITRGEMIVRNLILNVTILHRVKESEAVREALFMLRQGKQSPK